MLGEIAAVTLGILIAFALEAWWSDRATAEQEQVHLRALASDFQQNVELLGSLMETEESIMSSSQDLLELAQAPEPGSAASARELIGMVFNSGRYEPVMGAYEALVNSGGLTLLQDEALRASLAQFAAQVSGQYAEAWSNEHYFSFAREYAGRIMLHDVLELEIDRQGGTLRRAAAAEAVREPTYEELLRDRKFQEHLALRYYSERDMARKYRALLQQAEAVLGQVRAQIRD